MEGWYVGLGIANRARMKAPSGMQGEEPTMVASRPWHWVKSAPSAYSDLIILLRIQSSERVHFKSLGHGGGQGAMMNNSPKLPTLWIDNSVKGSWWKKGKHKEDPLLTDLFHVGMRLPELLPGLGMPLDLKCPSSSRPPGELFFPLKTQIK